MKKYLSIAVALAAALSLAACGSGSSSPAQTTAAETAPAQTETAAPETTAAETTTAETTTEETTTEAPAEETINWDDAGISYTYGTATLTFAQFYSGDVSSTDSYDAVSSATNSKYSIMANIASDFVDEVTNAEGYHITGVKNVAVAVPADQVDEYTALNDSFVPSEGEPAQYKKVAIKDGEAVYSPTQFNVISVEGASAELLTGSVWGDYQINVTDPEGQVLLRNTREDEGFAINGNIQGIIITTDSGLKVGMEFLQSIWVQPYEVSWNVSADNTHNVHIAGWDNMEELDKLVGETVTEITYIMPETAYVYSFDGIYVKPVYSGSAKISAAFEEGSAQVKVEGIPEDLENPTITVVMGSGRGRTTLVDKAVAENGTVTMKGEDGSDAVYDPSQVYTVTVNSDNYASLSADIPISAAEIEQLKELIAKAEAVLAEHDDPGVKEHKEEAEAIVADADATSGEAQELISELNSHISVYEPQAEDGAGEHHH